jgi:hypothetical protein
VLLFRKRNLDVENPFWAMKVRRLLNGHHQRLGSRTSDARRIFALHTEGLAQRPGRYFASKAEGKDAVIHDWSVR